MYTLGFYAAELKKSAWILLSFHLGTMAIAVIHQRDGKFFFILVRLLGLYSPALLAVMISDSRTGLTAFIALAWILNVARPSRGFLVHDELVRIPSKT